MPPLPALLVTVTLLGGYAAARLHAACRSALAELRAAERRLDPASGDGPGRALEDELRSYAEVASADRDSRWRGSAVVAVLLALLGVVLGIWSLTRDLGAYDAVVTVALALATVLIAALFVLDGVRTSATLAAAVDRFPLSGLRRLESSLAAVDAVPDPARMPSRPVTVARLRDAARRRAARRRAAALSRLPRVDVPAVRAAFPPGYAEGVRGLRALVPMRGPASVDDHTWEAALADLGRAAELDAPRRTRWLSALAACAELRDDPPARESAARWALDAAATGEPPRRRADPRTDPLPDSVAVRPTRPDTWAGALRRAVAVGAPAAVTADLTVRWAYSLVADAPRSAPALLEPAVAAAVEISHSSPDGETYLEHVRPGLEHLGAAPEQMGRLVPPHRRPATSDRPSADETPEGSGIAR